MNSLAVMQPYFFPYAGYFRLIQCAGTFIFLDDVSFINRGWINRNRILINGKEAYLTIPCRQAGQNRLINTIRHDLDDRIRGKLLKKLHHAYNKAPHFSTVYPLFEEVIHSDTELISEIAISSIVKTSALLGIETGFKKSSSMNTGSGRSGSERILEICHSEDAAVYYNLPGGRDMYDETEFKEQGINLFFLDTGVLRYAQFSDPFVPNLSILDVMMFNPVSKIRDWLDAAGILQ